MNASNRLSLESVWAQREDDIYPKLFGTVSRGIFALSAKLFSDVFKQSEIDPRWLHHGVFEYRPTVARQSWLYITSGTSNPWEVEPKEYSEHEHSGIGTELVLETHNQADWAINALQRLLAYNILLANGRFGDAETLGYGARVPLGGPINGDPSCQVRFLAVARANHYSASFSLPSGRVELLHLIGITGSERDYARGSSTAALIELLSASGAFPITDPTRTAVE